MKIFVTRKTMIKEFAKEIAELQRRADIAYYKNNDVDQSSYLTDRVIPLSEMCLKLGIQQKVYEEAYKIYDFRNSGREGYALIDGEIKKVS